MVRSLFISLSVIWLSYLLSLYVKSFESSQLPDKTVSTLEGVSIRVYGKGGIEWTVKGRVLEVVGKDVKFEEAVLDGKEAFIRAKKAYIDREKGEARLTEDVELIYKDSKAYTREAFVSLREGKIWGEGYIKLIEEGKEVEGKGFEITLKPMKVMINKARVKLE
jgi:lipopolysaccharide assembly outer membrane protein LptD (OstA)